MKSKLRFSIVLLGLAALPAQAAPITWTAYDITPNASDISTAGTVIDARGGGNSDVTVNGVTFKSVANSGNLFDSLFATDGIGARGHGNSYVTDANYRSLLGSGQRSGRWGFGDPRIEPTENWTTIHFSGLTIGNTYQIQIWASDGNFANPLSDGLIQTTALVLGDGSAGSPVYGTDPHIFYEMFDNQNSYYGGTGQYALGTFIAAATTQSVNVRKYNNTHTTPVATNGDHFSNGWQLRDLGASGPDITAPTPNPMTWANVPTAEGDSSISMTATAASDDSGVQYFFDETSGTTGGTDSGWQDSPEYTDTGLSPNTTYSYTVRVRDKSAGQNEGAASSEESATTDEEAITGPVDADISTVVASSPGVFANGIATASITVTLKDSNGLLISGEDVTLIGSPTGTTIGPAGTLATDSNGKAIFTVSSSTVRTVTFTASSATDSVVISQAVDIEFVDPATATAYNVNFLDEGQANVNGLSGLVGNRGETWNQGIMSINSLLDTSGNVSTVNVSGLGNDGRTIQTGTPPAGQLSLFNGGRGFFGKGQDTTMNITGLTPNTAYDLYIYALGSGAEFWGDSGNTERSAGDFVTTNTVNGNAQSQWLDNGKAGTDANSFLVNGNYVVFHSIVTDGSGKLSVLVDAYDGPDGISGTNDGDCRLYVNGLQIRPASGMSVDYAVWRAAHFPDVGLPEDDFDGDGLSNEYEHIFGLDPNKAASASPYTAPFDSEAGYFSYSRRTQSLINMNYKVWYSTDLEEWFEDNAASQTPESVVNDIEIMGVEIDPALLNEPRLFVQVGATPITQLDAEPSLLNLWGSGNTITLLFSEPMNSSSASNPDNYAVTQNGVGTLSVTGATLNPGDSSVTLTLESSVINDTDYTVNIDRVTSSTGQSLGSGVSRQFRSWDDDPNGIKVFILAGQSNMVGYGSVENGNGDVAGGEGSLRYLAVNNGSFPEYDYTSLLENPADPANSAWDDRSDVKIWWRDGRTGYLGGAVRKGNLGGPPFQGAQTTLIGPEFAFGHVLGNHYASDDVLIIKTAWGGRDLAEKFRPPGAVANRGGQVGPFYNAIIDYTREVLNNLDTEFPEWSGRGYEIVGFAWHQGFNDRLSTAFSNEYKDNLPDLISDVRDVFSKPDMPFVVASTGMATGAAEAPPYSGYSGVEKAQLWVAGVDKPAHVLSTDTRPFWRESGVSPAAQGHHWNWNAQSYFLIGKSMGDNMVDLLTP